MSPETREFVMIINAAIDRAEEFGFAGTAESLRATLSEFSRESRVIVAAPERLTALSNVDKGPVSLDYLSRTARTRH